ncbi:hypothetical protein NEUTE1DRAFT_103911 [Neurospora tetrasperma FGSC 2508]|uniref:Uncharacterized protein n=1 Tax=Neurospora tetrasperma (strain FGSC 2508 / ATCC MYA-4615 / P0657) TaxID=510951 RepID=F8MXJ0_NEUT8|nr:uncharacterized protein NEUTE1DRAFT_103911 [Neurospora tetrasperma FGSC 2508]EGO54461.1 hypothetical protein NEUTE1DRAFT_103911 [Neurospora tetrasperma FGSC 2508]
MPSSSAASSPSTTCPTLPSITHSLLQTSLSLKRDFRFLKLTVRVSNPDRSSLEIAFDESETHKLLRTSLTRLNSATRCFIRDANILLDEEVNRSFDAYLRRSDFYSGFHKEQEEEGQEGEEEGQEGGEKEEGWHVLDMTSEEKETRRELRRVLEVVEELRGVFLKKAGKYVLNGVGGKVFKEKGDDGDLGDLVGVLGKLNEDGDGEDGKGKEGKMTSSLAPDDNSVVDCNDTFTVVVTTGIISRHWFPFPPPHHHPDGDQRHVPTDEVDNLVRHSGKNIKAYRPREQVAALNEHLMEETQKLREEAIKKDPTRAAELHGNKPCKGALIDKELAEEDAAELRKKEQKLKQGIAGATHFKNKHHHRKNEEEEQ